MLRARSARWCYSLQYRIKTNCQHVIYSLSGIAWSLITLYRIKLLIWLLFVLQEYRIWFLSPRIYLQTCYLDSFLQPGVCAVIKRNCFRTCTKGIYISFLFLCPSVSPRANCQSLAAKLFLSCILKVTRNRALSLEESKQPAGSR